MKRTNYFMPIDLHSKLKIYSKESGVPMSEIIRRAIDKYLSENYNGTRKQHN